MMQPAQIVYVVDGNSQVREELSALLTSHGWTCWAFGSAAEFLCSAKPDAPACLALDFGLPDLAELALEGGGGVRQLPTIVFISDRADIPACVWAMKAGAADFLTKPLNEDAMLQAVQLALAADVHRWPDRRLAAKLEDRYRALTRRERQVLPLVVRGLVNKQAAAELGISEITMRIHRGKVMQKMEADSLPDLVRMAATLRIPMPCAK